jgi:hypothetical protein
VKFSKEAKAFQEKQQKKSQQDQMKKIDEFVRELYRVYMKELNPTQDEIQKYSNGE